MKFKIDFDIEPLHPKINHADALFFIGSCFAENIAAKLYGNKFNIHLNPNGIIFNPISIFKMIDMLCDDKRAEEGDCIQSDEMWYSFQHHSIVRATTKEELMLSLGQIHLDAKAALMQAKHLVITMGSAWVYEHIITKKIVANCHKVPQNQFTKRLLSTEEIISAFEQMFKKLKVFNPEIHIVLTVSPVKYLRDGVVENNLSKSTLLLAANTLKEKYHLNYFPAFEIVNDELRDYRFYDSDLAHPSAIAIDYVWDRFVESCMSSESILLMKQLDEIIKAYKHRPFNEETLPHKNFKKRYLQKAKQLNIDYPYLDLRDEILYFSV